eukprot:7296353-Alexandrium_andersonii.AAC.1
MSQRRRHCGPPQWSWCDVGSTRTQQATCNMQHHVSLKRHASCGTRHAARGSCCTLRNRTCDM